VLAITFDIDWSPDVIVDEIVQPFEQADIPVTLFCTNPETDRTRMSSNLTGRYHQRHELALHPNFIYSTDYVQVFRDLTAQYPGAVGWRSHNGLTGWPIQVSGVDSGLGYEVYCTVFPSRMQPFKVNKDRLDLYIFTTNFYDSQMMTVDQYDWSLGALNLIDDILDESRIVVAGFHPNIVYYNITSQDMYEQLKPSYHQPNPNHATRRKFERGPRTLIRSLLEQVPRERFTTIADFAIKHGYQFGLSESSKVEDPKTKAVAGVIGMRGN
jgi:hypothetical protein